MRYISRISVLLALTLFSIIAHAQTWKNEPDMKVKRSEAAAVEYNGDLYVFNGFSRGLQVGNSVEKYNPDSKQWTLLGSTSVDKGTAVTHTGTVLVGSEVWLLGGRVGAHPGRVTDDVWIYNLQNNQWREGPKLPQPMAAGGAAVVNNKIYIFGGIDSQAKCDVNYHYEYNLDSPSSGWKNITSSAAMPSPRNHFSTVTVNSLIYAIGGQNGHDGCPGTPGGNVALVHTFNPSNKTWTRVANLPATESHNEPATFVHNGFIYSAGGNGLGNKVVRYDPATDKWQQVATLAEKLNAAVARIYNGQLIVAGGGAPITSQSTVSVRSLESSKFNDVAQGASALSDTSNSDTSDNDNNNDNNNDSSISDANNNAATDTDGNVNSPTGTPVIASTDVINVSGSNISWPDDGWYQVQNENGYSEVCAGGRSCDVSSGSYVVINHSTGQRFDGIQVGQSQSTIDIGSDITDSPIVVSGSVISWPNNGWYQVQDARDYSEICAGGASCTVSSGTYNVINHNTGVRYDGISVTTDFSDLRFAEKLALFEQQANQSANNLFLDINRQYVSGTLNPALASCIPAKNYGLSIATALSCGSEYVLVNTGVPISELTYEVLSVSKDNDDAVSCRESLANQNTEACLLNSVSLFDKGLYIQYGTSNRAYSESRSIVISDDSLDISGFVLTAAFGQAACFVELNGDSQWSLLYGSNFPTCDQRLTQALSALE